MNGRRLGWLCALALVASSSSALAQDSAVTPPKAQAPAVAPKAPTLTVPKAPPQTTAADPQVELANQMASIATREATCLREAAQHVTLAAQRLSSAPADQIDKRREELAFHVGVMEECRNIARQRQAETAPAFAEPPPPAERPRERRGHFSFGEILIESGAADAAVMASPLRKNAGRFTRCYERAGKSAARSKLRMRVRMVPGGSGARPSTIVIPGAPRRDGGLHRCLANALMETPFPRSLVGSDVSFMMGFSK